MFYPERPTPQTVFEMLRGYQPTMFFAVPTLYAAMLADPECKPENMLEPLRMCFSAGEPLPAHIGENWKQRFGVDIVNGVGSTEMGHLFLTNLPERRGVRHLRRAGRRATICAWSTSTATTSPTARSAKCWCAGSRSAAGYWNQREKTRRTFVGEWTRTGDKYVRAAGRRLHLLRPHRRHVQGERHLGVAVRGGGCTWSAIRRCSRPPWCRSRTTNGLIKPKAFVVLKDQRDNDAGRALYEELKVHVKRAIGPWKYPRWIEFVDSLPKTATGKIQRFMLRDKGLVAHVGGR